MSPLDQSAIQLLGLIKCLLTRFGADVGKPHGHFAPGPLQVLLDERRATSGRPFFFLTPRVPINAVLRHACWRTLDITQSPHEDQSLHLEREDKDLISTAIARTAGPSPWRRRCVHARAHCRAHRDGGHGREGGPVQSAFILVQGPAQHHAAVFWSAVRVEEVVRRLVFREEPLTSVALELSFSSSGNFSRFLKEHMCVSPSRFRRVATVSKSHPITGLS